MTLTEFLLARIDEDEEAALSAVGYESRVYWSDAVSTKALRGLSVLHYERHTPDHVLAECEAKRRIVEALEDAEAATRSVGSDPKAPGDWQEWGNYHAWRNAAELIGLPYADHADYDPEWRPNPQSPA